MPPVVQARIRAKIGLERQLEQALNALIKKAEKSAAGRRYTLYRCVEEPGLLILWEHHDRDCSSVSEAGTGGLIVEIAGMIDGRPLVETLTEVAEDV